MSSEDLAALTLIWEEWSGPIGGPEERDSFRGRWWHPEITYEEDPRWPGSGSYQGKDEVAKVFEAYLRAYWDPQDALAAAGIS